MPQSGSIWFVLGVVLLTGDLSGQYDPAAPEPMKRLRGSLVLSADDSPEGMVLETFQDLAGDDPYLVHLLVAPVRDAPELADEMWQASLWMDGSLTGNAAVVEHLRVATGVYLTSPEPGFLLETLPGTEVVTALSQVIERGGVVLASAEASCCMGSLAMVGGQRVGREQPGLSILPGTVIDAAGGEDSAPRLLSVVAAYPELVGLSVGPGAALVIRGRRMHAEGQTSAYTVVAANERQGWRVGMLSPGDRRSNRADLIALHRDARARNLPAFPPDPLPVPDVKNGTLFIVGGGGVPDGLLEEFIEHAGGPDALLVYVPCAEEEVIEREPSTVRRLREAGATRVTWIHTKDRRKADTDEAILGPLREAGGIWFGGGRQWNLVDSYQHTEAHRLMEEVLARGGAIGGSSAGASIQGDYMCRGDPLQNFNILAPGYETGLGFLAGVGIDQHFFRRNRLPDMTELMGIYPHLLGIGIDETTAIVVQRNRARVTGRSKVAFYDRGKPVLPDQPDYEAVTHGGVYDLAARRVVVQPERLAELAGLWEFTSQSATRKAQRTLELSQGGSSLADSLGKLKLRELSLLGDDLEFRVVLPLTGDVRFVGSVGDGVIDGKFWRADNDDPEGDFHAIRVISEKSARQESTADDGGR